MRSRSRLLYGAIGSLVLSMSLCGGRGGAATDTPPAAATTDVGESQRSSFHLAWEGLENQLPIVEIRATLEVVRPPAANHLYFWALQASFADVSRSYGTAHIGLQWNPRFPGLTAVNWGGYRDADQVQSVLPGSTSPLASAPQDPNTRQYAWRAGVTYRLRVYRGENGWLGEITDGSTGRTVTLRELFAAGDRLDGVTMWAEVFAACDDPRTAVRWSDLQAIDAAGVVHTPTAVQVTFPNRGDCPNTDVTVDDSGLLQLTNAVRTKYDVETLPLPAA